MQDLRYEGATVFVENVGSASIGTSYEYEVFSNLDDAKLGGGWSDSLGKIKSQFKAPGDKILWAKTGKEIKLGA